MLVGALEIKVANEFYPEIVFYYVVVFVNVTLRFKVLVLEIFLHLQWLGMLNSAENGVVKNLGEK